MSRTNNVYLQEVECGMFKYDDHGSPSQEAPATIDNDSVVPTSPEDGVAMIENDKEVHFQRSDEEAENQKFQLAEQVSCIASAVLVEKVEHIHQGRKKGQIKCGRMLKLMQSKLKALMEKSGSSCKRKPRQTKKTLKVVNRKVKRKKSSGIAKV